jgi:hypothetical protein
MLSVAPPVSCFRINSVRSAIFTIGLLLGPSAAFAQLPQARLYSVFPCGGQAGTTFDLELTNSADLDEADHLVFNHQGITAVPRTHDVGGRQQPIPNTFSATIGPDVPSGVYELYAGGLFGLSNPRTFVVGSQPESREREPNNSADGANDIPLNGIVNGVINAETDVDVFRFSGKKGQRFVAFCRAADLDSRLSPALEITDADGRRLAFARQQVRRDPVVDVVLPADGIYFVNVHDFLYRGGPEYGYRLSAGSVPYIDYIMPPVGVAGSTAKYTVFGRNLPGSKPAATAIDGQALEKAEVEIKLPAIAPRAPSHTTLRALDAGLEVVSYVLKSPVGESNPMLIALAKTPPILEREPNDTPQTAQEIPAPGEFAGQFQAPGDTDFVKFRARQGQVFYIEVFADRLGSPADPYLVVEQVERNSKGAESVTRMTAVDDDNSNIAPAIFDTRTDDPSYRFQAPADGMYRIMLRDRSFESRGDPRLVYRLSIRPEEPDFQLVVLPQYPKRGSVQAVSTWALGLRKGDSREAQILVIRKDGFREPIDVWAEGLPAGVTCRGSALASNAKTSELIFTAAENAPESSALIHIFGKARLPGAKRGAAVNTANDGASKELVHEAIPGTIVWSATATAPAVSRVGQSLGLSVMKETAPFQLSTDVARLEVNQSRQILLPLKLARRNGFDADVAMTLVGLAPGNLNLQNQPFAKGKSEELLRMFVARGTRPGTYAVYWSTQAAVAYRRNLFALERAQHEQSAVVKTAQEANAEAKVVSAARDQAIKKQSELAATIKRLRSSVARLEQRQIAARRDSKVSVDAKAPHGTSSTQIAEISAEVAEFAQKSADEAAAAARSTSAASKPEIRARATAAARLADDLRKEAGKAAKMPGVSDPLVWELHETRSKLAKAEGEQKAAIESSRQAAALATAASTKSKQFTAARIAADARLAEATKSAAPQNVTDFPPSTPLLLTVKAAPLDLSATAATRRPLKRGGRFDVKLKVRRARGFNGPVTVVLPMPSGVAGIKAAPVRIPAAKTEGLLTIVADKAASLGDVANLVVRGQADFEGNAEVDAPITLKIVP